MKINSISNNNLENTDASSDISPPLYDERKINKNLLTLTAPRSYEAERFRMLRTRLLFPDSGESPKTIMITSASPNEGKSFVALNLAISIAQCIDKYVLLMDCDMRNPTAHRYLGFGEVKGLSEYLAGEIPISSLFYKTAIDKLTMSPGGSPPLNPSELLGSAKMKQLLDEVKNRFSDRYIIIDSPPPKITADSNVIAKQVDGIILVVKYNATPKEMLNELIETLGKERIIGVVINQFDFVFDKFEKKKYYRNYFRD